MDLQNAEFASQHEDLQLTVIKEKWVQVGLMRYLWQLEETSTTALEDSTENAQFVNETN